MPRVKRLYATYFILAAAVGAAVYFSGMLRISLGALFLWASLTGFAVLAANTINRPIENRIAGWYIEDARKILNSMNNLTVIGITGSYGKTSTKNFLASLLAARYNVLMTPKLQHHNGSGAHGARKAAARP